MRSTSGPFLTTAEQAVTEAYRSEWGRLLSVLVVSTRRLDLAEDALADAFSRAATRWPVDGVPANPAGWLFVAARRFILGVFAARRLRVAPLPILAVRGTVSPTFEDDVASLPDERLQLVLLCCHPALEPASRSALALRLVIGTSTNEIARLFLVSTSTMAARLTRAKRKIVAAGIPLVLPVEDELTVRLDAVTRTIYLAFTAGYVPGTGTDLLRPGAAGDVVRLAAMLHHLVPAPPKFKHYSPSCCFNTRVETPGSTTASSLHWRIKTALSGIEPRLTPLFVCSTQFLRRRDTPKNSDSRPWRHVSTQRPSHRQLPNWTEIAALYAELEACTGSPIVRLNRAVAIAELSGPASGLAVLDGLDEVLDQHHRFHGVRADLARRAGNIEMAKAAYTRAIELCGNETEQSFLRKQLGAIVTNEPGEHDFSNCS